MHIKDITREIDETNAQKINAERHELHRKILVWRESLLIHMPEVAEIIPEGENKVGDDLESKRLCLRLPSDFSHDDWRRLWLEALVTTELELRKGEANDAIQTLRSQINFKLGLEEQKKKAKYTKSLTRVSKLLQDAQHSLDAVADKYCAARKAIIALGGDGGHKYKELLNEDIDVKDIKGGHDKKHTGKLTNRWISKKVVSLAGSTQNDTKWEKDSKCFLITCAMDADTTHIVNGVCWF